MCVKKWMLEGFTLSSCLPDSASAKAVLTPTAKIDQSYGLVYQELVYRNKVLKTMLTGSLSCPFPVLLRFLRNFSRSAFPAILQPGTGWMQVCPREIYPWLQVFCFGHGWWIGPEHSVYIYHWLIVSCIDARWRPIRFRKGFYTLQICECA